MIAVFGMLSAQPKESEQAKQAQQIPWDLPGIGSGEAALRLRGDSAYFLGLLSQCRWACRGCHQQGRKQ